MTYSFFLSYARGDDDRYVEEFFADLRCATADLLGADDPEGTAFLGAAPSGRRDEWDPAQFDALARASVFVAVASPRYFLNDWAGRHWWIFAERLRRYAEETGLHAPALLPVVWSAVDAHPGSGYGLVYPDPDQPRLGLRQLARLRSLRREYEHFVCLLARRVVDTATSYQPPPYAPLPGAALVPSAFTVRDETLPGGQRVRFVVAAGSRDEMTNVRENLAYYGSEPEDWAPYRPGMPEPLAGRAQAVAANRLFRSDVSDAEGLADVTAHSRAHNEIVILLVDPWSTRLAAYRRLLSEADRTSDAAVLVPLNSTDAESAQHRDELRYAVTQVFRHSSGQETRYRGEISSAERFDVDLSDILEEAKNRMFRDGRVRHSPPGEPLRRRPILGGP